MDSYANWAEMRCGALIYTRVVRDWREQCDIGITGLLPLLKDITRDVHLRSFSGKVAAQSTFTAGFTELLFSVSKREFWDRSNAVRINTSFLHVLKVFDFERKLFFSALLTSDFFYQVH